VHVETSSELLHQSTQYQTLPSRARSLSQPCHHLLYHHQHRSIHCIHMYISMLSQTWTPSIPCGCCTCLEFLATQCLGVYVVAGFLLSASKDSPVCCVISSLTLNAILELSFCTVPLQQFLRQRHLNHIRSFVRLFVRSFVREHSLTHSLIHSHCRNFTRCSV